MYYIIDIVKVLACLLIANFHSDILFPEKFSLLAFGGDLGNNIFFMVSGFALLPSVEKSNFHSIGKWYFKRLERLLPMLIFFYLLTWGTRSIVLYDLVSVVNAFIFPTIYWFTGALLIYYLLYFVYEKCFNYVFHIGSIILLTVLHLYWDNILVERYFIGFISMLIGAWLRKNFEPFTKKIRTKKILPLIFLTGILYMTLKLLRRKEIEILGFIHLGIGISTILMALEIILWGGAYEDRIAIIFEKHPRIYCVIQKLSTVTLAVYLLMGLDNRIIMKSVKACFAFPFSYMINMVISFFGAYIITVIDKKLHELKNGYT